MDTSAETGLKQQLLAETSKISWKELQIFFAQGKAIHASSQLDLLDVAACISTDDSPQVKQWMDDGLLAPVSDEQARLWFDNDILVWAVVVKPWVLVQNLKDAIEPA
jgi:hypothetical protein